MWQIQAIAKPKTAAGRRQVQAATEPDYTDVESVWFIVLAE